MQLKSPCNVCSYDQELCSQKRSRLPKSLSWESVAGTVNIVISSRACYGSQQFSPLNRFSTVFFTFQRDCCNELEPKMLAPVRRKIAVRNCTVVTEKNVCVQCWHFGRPTEKLLEIATTKNEQQLINHITIDRATPDKVNYVQATTTVQRSNHQLTENHSEMNNN